MDNESGTTLAWLPAGETRLATKIRGVTVTVRGCATSSKAVKERAVTEIHPRSPSGHIAVGRIGLFGTEPYTKAAANLHRTTLAMLGRSGPLNPPFF